MLITTFYFILLSYQFFKTFACVCSSRFYLMVIHLLSLVSSYFPSFRFFFITFGLYVTFVYINFMIFSFVNSFLMWFEFMFSGRVMSDLTIIIRLGSFSFSHCCLGCCFACTCEDICRAIAALVLETAPAKRAGDAAGDGTGVTVGVIGKV